MEVLYDIAAHPLLTDRATALSPEKLSWQQFQAERLLALTAPAYTATADVAVAVLAIVLQINFQLAQGLDPLIEEAASSSHLKQSKVWRDRHVNPQSVALIATIPGQKDRMGDRWSTLSSFRTE